MAQSYGSITVTDLTDITDVYIQYGLAVESANVTNNYAFSQTGEISWSTTVPEWKIGYKVWRREATVKEGLGTTYSTPVEDTSLNGIQSRLRYMWTNLIPHTNGSDGWIKPTYPAGSYMASGISGTSFDYEDSGTYGYNLFMDNNSLKFRYNGFKLSELSGTALSFYSPSITSQGSELMNLSGLNGLIIKNTSGDTVANFNSTITLGKPYGPTDYNAAKLELTNKSLKLLKNYIGAVFSINTDSSYTSVSGASKTHSTIMQIGANMDTDEEFISFARITPTDFGYYLTINSNVLQNYPIFTLDAINKRASFYDGEGHLMSTFDANGLKAYKGGIEAGQAGLDGFIYLSTIDYPLENSTVVPAISGITINGYTPSAAGTNGREIDDPAWRQIIGEKFGVDSEGNLYASDVNITGKITATEGTIGGISITNGNLIVGGSHIADGAIETRHITTDDIEGTNGSINLRSGTFDFYSEDSNERISWNGNSLDITGSINVTGGGVANEIEGLNNSTGTVEWACEYGKFKLSTDRESVPGKLYFTITVAVQQFSELEEYYYTAGKYYTPILVAPDGQEGDTWQGYAEVTYAISWINSFDEFKAEVEQNYSGNPVYLLQTIQKVNVSPNDDPLDLGYYELVGYSSTMQNFMSSHMTFDKNGLHIFGNSYADRIDISSIASNGVTIYNNDSQVAQYGSKAIIGNSNQFHITISSADEEIAFWQGQETAEKIKKLLILVVVNYGLHNLLSLSRWMLDKKLENYIQLLVNLVKDSGLGKYMKLMGRIIYI